MQVYLIMHVLMFIAAMRLRRSQPDHERGYRAPALGLLCLLGAVSSAAAFVIGFVPPAQFGHSNPLVFRPEQSNTSGPVPPHRYGFPR